MPERPTYTREEMDAILRRAIERQQAKAEGVGHDDLVAAAEEVGIPRAEVEAAAQELSATRNERALVDDARRRAIRRFVGVATSWAVFSLVLAVMGIVQHRGWVLWPILGWGAAVVMQAVRVFVTRDYTRARESRRERRRRRREEKLRDFEAKVEIGTNALLRVMDEIRAGREPRSGPPVREKIDFEPMTPTRVVDRYRIDPRDPDGIEVEAPRQKQEGRKGGR